MKFLCVVCFLVITINGNAQEFKGGLFSGIAASQVSGDELAGYNKAGFVLGGFAQRALNEKSLLEMQMMYIQKGSRKASKPDKGDYFFYLLNLDYVEVPLLFKFIKGKFTYEVGPSFGVLVKFQVQNQDGFYPVGHPQNRAFNRFETSINGGINYPLWNNFEMNWRISNSLLPIRDHQSGQTFRLNWGQYNTVLLFVLRYTFKKADE